MHIIGKVNGVLGRTAGINIKKSQRDLHKFYATQLDSYIKDVDAAFTKSLSVPKFLDSKDAEPLHVDIDATVRAVRLSLPTLQYFHLHSIVLFGEDGKRLDIDDGVQVLTSSSHNEDVYSADETKKLLSSPRGKHPFAFHTLFEPSPWVTILFSEPTTISSVSITNAPGYIAMRAAGLTVSTSTNLKKWKVVHNIGGGDNFAAEAKKIASEYHLPDYIHGDLVSNYIISLLSQGNKTTKTYYNQLPPEYQPALRESVNKIMLKRRGIEWTSHGMMRSFRFYSTKEKQDYIRRASQVVKDLQSLSPDVCLGFGSVLAVVRDKDLLPHDDDMDIIIGFKPSQAATIKQALKILAPHLKAKGHLIRKKGFNHCYVSSEGLKIDVFVGIYDDDDTIGWFPGRRHVLKRADVFPAKSATMLGVKCAVPKNPEVYLESIYGKGWRTPQPGYRHNWPDKSEYADIIGE